MLGLRDGGGALLLEHAALKARAAEAATAQLEASAREARLLDEVCARPYPYPLPLPPPTPSPNPNRLLDQV